MECMLLDGGLPSLEGRKGEAKQRVVGSGGSGSSGGSGGSAGGEVHARDGVAEQLAATISRTTHCR